MKVVRTKAELELSLGQVRKSGGTIGLVPTMGALHRGHASLVRCAVQANDITVVSVFVNPTQFNDPLDLQHYPRTPESDINLLTTLGAQLVFMPTVAEMYPVPDTRQFDFGLLGQVMEGAHRPGHFNGVAQVVSKLFELVRPTRAYFGQKDFQQIAIVRRLVQMLDFDLQIVSCPIVREPDGLAVSSRNSLLTPQCRQSAPLIARTLFQARNLMTSSTVHELTDWVVEQINADANLRVEYFEIADADTLQRIDGWDQAERVVGCVVVHAGNVRLIDNVIFK